MFRVYRAWFFRVSGVYVFFLKKKISGTVLGLPMNLHYRILAVRPALAATYVAW